MTGRDWVTDKVDNRDVYLEKLDAYQAIQCSKRVCHVHCYQHVAYGIYDMGLNFQVIFTGYFYISSVHFLKFMPID
jgi:hypothetical protein